MFLRAAVFSLLILTLATTFAPSAATEVSGPAPAIAGAKPGNELVIFRTRDFRSLDPARIFNVDEVVFSNFIFRTLTQYRTIRGKTELLPDLAVSLGKASNNYQTWSYQLRAGIKYQDGRTLGCQDIKYGLMRSFADDVLSGGAPYAKMYLQTSANYRGPYTEPDKDLTSVVCRNNNKTIVFNLNRPVPYFDQIAALPTFAPVPKSSDTKVNYGQRPVSSGPYQISSWAPGKELILTRNKFWSPKSDPIRWAYPDRLKVKLAVAAEIIEQSMLADRDDAKRAVMMDASILTNRKLVNNYAIYKERSISLNDTPAWLAINSDSVKNIKVRKAIQCAIDYRTVVAAAGGLQYGSYASSIIPTSFESAYRKFDICGRSVQSKPQPQTQRAQNLLAAVPTPEKKIDFAYSDRGIEPLIASAIAQSLRLVGFQVNLNKIPQNLFSSTIRERNTSEPDVMLWGRWRPDWQASSGQIYPLLDGRTLTPTSAANNFARQNFKEIQDLFIKADKAKSSQAQEKLLGDIEQLAVSKYGVMMPLVSQRLIFLYGSSVGGVELSKGHNTLTFASAYLK
jgi:peptide/nickel transport system substrate-binding protein